MKGEVIAIIGAPGVGTSFLTKQLACRHCRPAFFEGEEGIFTSSVVSVLNNEVDSPERWVWITNRSKKVLENAHAIAQAGITSYIDGSDILLAEAWLNAEIGDHSPIFLKNWIEQYKHLMADKVLIITASEEKVRQNITNRARLSEQTSFIKERALRIGAECAKLELKYKHSKVLDRTHLEFTETDTLEMIDGIINNIPSLQK